jgi:hypothetical protein
VLVSRRKGAGTSVGVGLLGTVWANSMLFPGWFWQREDIAAAGFARCELQPAGEARIPGFGESLKEVYKSNQTRRDNRNGASFQSAPRISRHFPLSQVL